MKGVGLQLIVLVPCHFVGSRITYILTKSLDGSQHSVSRENNMKLNAQSTMGKLCQGKMGVIKSQANGVLSLY